MQPVVTANVWNICQNSCEYCVSHAPDRSRDPNDDGRDYSEVLDVHALILWLDEFRPTARVHVSGGEPLLYDGIEDWIFALLDAGRKVTILTNGQAFHSRKRLHNAPINWIVTYHLGCGQSIASWASGLAGLDPARSYIKTIITEETQLENELVTLREALSEFDVRPSVVGGPRDTARMWGLRGYEDISGVGELLALVESDGAVYGCNCKALGAIGNLYSLTCESAARVNARADVCAQTMSCGAFLTAWNEQA